MTANKEYAFQIPGYEYEFFGRVGTSDEANANDIFQHRQYDALKINPAKDVRVIVDLGAYVGYASRYFLHTYPEANIIAVEPHRESYELARRNLEPYKKRVMLVHGAIWSHACNLAVVTGEYRDGRHWSTQTLPPTGANIMDVEGTEQNVVRALAMHELVPPGLQIDLLKIDVEGAEEQLFKANTAWLDRVRNIVMEIHEPAYFKTILRAISEYHVDDVYSVGELTVIKGMRPKGITTGEALDRLAAASPHQARVTNITSVD